MKEIVFKDKVITITQDMLDVKRLPGKWFQSFFELIFIRVFIVLFIFFAIFKYILFLNGDVIDNSSYFTGFIGGVGAVLIIYFLGYYRNKSIPLNQIKYGDVNKANQLVVTYSEKKGFIKQVINLPKNHSERKQVIKQLQEVIPIEDCIRNYQLIVKKDAQNKSIYKYYRHYSMFGASLCFTQY